MIKIVKGDILQGIKNKNQDDIIVIPQILNNVGHYGAGVSGVLEKAFPGIKDSYRKTLKDFEKIKRDALGHTDYITTLDKYLLAGMIAQDNRDMTKSRLVNYAAMATCMADVELKMRAFRINNINASIHTIRFGSGIGGGSQAIIEEFINWHWGDFDVTIYEL